MNEVQRERERIAERLRAEREAAAPTYEPLPAPEHTSRDPWPTGFTVPRGARDLGRIAEQCGWAITITYARGPRLDRRAQLSGIFHSVCVRGVRPGRQFIASYVCPVEGAQKWSGDGVLLTRGEEGIFPRASVTDLKEWIIAGGTMPAEWYTSINERIEGQKVKAKEAARARPKKAREDVS